MDSGGSSRLGLRGAGRLSRGGTTHKSPRVRLRLWRPGLRLCVVFTCARQLFMNELKLKMAVVDARRKWLPREKVMPGKNRAETTGTSRGEARGRPMGAQSACVAVPCCGLGLVCHPWVSGGYDRDEGANALGENSR